MPATSEKQKKFMDAVAHNPAFAKSAGVPTAVGKDFSKASKGMTFGGGPRTRADSQSINNPKTNQGKQELFKKGGNAMATKKMSSKMMAFEKSGKDVEMKGVKEGSKADMAMDKKQMMKKGGAAKKMASGGSASARADGVATKGKTKGKMLAKGGKAYC